jgi:predicted protein tyrosine phosphatase
MSKNEIYWVIRTISKKMFYSKIVESGKNFAELTLGEGEQFNLLTESKYHEILPGLWLGGSYEPNGQYPKFDLVAQIPHRESENPTLKGIPRTSRLPVIDNEVGLESLKMKCGDNLWIHQIVREIIDALRSGKTVLVHCQAGVDRSATVVACVIATMYPDIPREIILNYIRSIRYIAEPKPSYRAWFLNEFQVLGSEVSEVPKVRKVPKVPDTVELILNELKEQFRNGPNDNKDMRQMIDALLTLKTNPEINFLGNESETVRQSFIPKNFDFAPFVERLFQCITNEKLDESFKEILTNVIMVQFL